MGSPLDLRVWRIELDTLPDEHLPPPTPEEAERAARFAVPDLRRRYLNAHRAMRAILRRTIGGEPRIVAGENGKPWLPDAPQWQFNLSHSRGLALLAVARGVEVGVDVEYIRAHLDWEAIAERFFPPAAAAEFFRAPEADRDREFFRQWTRLEATWKALGVGLYGADRELEGPWTVTELDLGSGIAGAAAARAESVRVELRDFEPHR